MAKEEFARHVEQGLSQTPKVLDSKYLYDDNGSRLFQFIMNMPEYYPTDSEYEILSEKQNQFQEHINNSGPVEFIELGAGDGLKIIPFLHYFKENNIPFQYRPVDISAEAIEMLEKRIHQKLPELKTKSLQMDFFEALKQISKEQEKHHVYLFLGSNIGNFRQSESLSFLRKIRENIHKNDLLIIGFYLVKAPRIIIRAYDDPYGLTASFNLNLLKRINYEFNAGFDLSAFQFYPFYHPDTGEVKSYIYSLKKQNVPIDDLQMHVPFEPFEFIQTEISKKFSLQEIEHLARETGFTVVDHIFDRKHYFSDSIFKAL